VTSQLPLRDYQRDALDAVRDAWSRGVQRPAVVAPTGAGKTVMFSHLIADRLGGEDGRQQGRALVLVHRDELADQAMDKISQVSPGLRVGKVKADDNEVNADVVVASVQTLAVQSRLDELILRCDVYGAFGLVVVDECHHAVAPSWRRVMTQLGCFSLGERVTGPEHCLLPDVVGFSATLARGDGIGLGSVWQEVAYAISLTRLIRRGHLADVRGVQVRVEDLDLADVRRSGGDYQVGSLGEAMMDSHAPTTIASAYREHAADRQGVVFTPTVETAHESADELNRAGIVSEVITGTTPREDRPDQTLAEAVEEAELAALADEAEREAAARQSRLTAKVVDLFEQSTSVWLRTKAGVWFIPTREGEFFLWPASEPGKWDVCEAPMDGYKRKPWERRYVNFDIETAMSWAQTLAEEADPSVATKAASWRKHGGKASEAQKGMLKRFYSPNEYDEDTIKKSTASDMISIGIASKVFDRHYAKLG
jgi:hypothetical protein